MANPHDKLNQTWLPDGAGESCLSLARYVNVLVCESPAIGTGGITGLPATFDWLIVRLNHLLGRLNLELLRDVTLMSRVALVEASLKSGDGHAKSLAADAWNAINCELNHLLTRLADAAKERELPSWWELDPDVQYIPCHPIRDLADLKRWVKQVRKWVITPGTGTPAEVMDRELDNIRESLGQWEPNHTAYEVLSDTDIERLTYMQAKQMLAKVDNLLANPQAITRPAEETPITWIVNSKKVWKAMFKWSGTTFLKRRKDYPSAFRDGTTSKSCYIDSGYVEKWTQEAK